MPTAITPRGNPAEEEDENVEDNDPVLEEDDFEDNNLSDEAVDNIEWEPEEEQEESSGNA